MKTVRMKDEVSSINRQASLIGQLREEMLDEMKSCDDELWSDDIESCSKKTGRIS